MTLHPGIRHLAVLLFVTTAYGRLIAPVAATAGSEAGAYLLTKGVLAALLLGYVLTTGQARSAGLVGRSNLRTLPLYWPLFLLMLLILLGPSAPPDPGTLLTLAGVALCVGFAEELMFRGLVFHWFRDLTARARILVSAFAFGLAHLGGLLATDAVAVVLAQCVFASAVGAVFACARDRDDSIWLPVAVHAGFDFVAFAAAGGIGQALEDTPATVVRLLVPGLLIWAWAGWLIRRAPRAAPAAV